MEACLTRGNIRPQLISLSAPLLMGNILQQLYNTIDAVIVGQLVGQNAFAAVGVSGSIMNLFLFLIGGGCAGAGVLLSQFYGADDRKRFRNGFFLMTAAGLVVTIFLSGFALITLDLTLELLQTPEEILLYAKRYLCPIYIGLFSAFLYHCSSAVLRAVGDTKASLVFLVFSMALNLVLDLFFVGALRMDTRGAALATVLAQIFSAVLNIGYIVIRYPELMFQRRDRCLDCRLLKNIARFSLVSALQMCNLYIGKLLVQGTVNALGTDAIAGYTAALRIEGFANSFGDSLCTSVSVFTGQNTGAKERERVMEGYRDARRLLLLLGLLMAALMILFAGPLVGLLLPGSGESLIHAVRYLRLVACFYVFNFLGSGLSGYFQGRGRMDLPVIGTTAHILIRVLIASVSASAFGLEAVAIATGIGWIFVVVFWEHYRKVDFRQIAML